MIKKIVGVKFKNSGKTYFFDCRDHIIQKDDHVIVETGTGIDYGTAVTGMREIDEEKFFQPLKPVLRKAGEKDEEQVQENKLKSKDAYDICLERIKKHGLDMKLTEVEYAFDNSKILFYFTSDGYVDFRELVKDLAGTFRTRIELRQIGVRDEARAIGGLGACGRPMCCASYLEDFVPVSIKMAKEQNLPLNPTKISGVCGRLMCCLKYEEETYEELNKTMPDVGDFVEGFDGLQGEVFSTNVLRQTVKVVVEEGDEKELHDYPANGITILRKRRGKKNNAAQSPAELESTADEKQLEALEDSPQSKKESTAETKSRPDNNTRKEPRDSREPRESKESREPKEAKEPRNGNNGGDGNNGKQGDRNRGKKGKHFRNGDRRNGRKNDRGENNAEGK